MAEYVVTKIEDCTVDHKIYRDPTTCPCRGTGKVRTDVPIMDVLRMIHVTKPFVDPNAVGVHKVQLVYENDELIEPNP